MGRGCTRTRTHNWQQRWKSDARPQDFSRSSGHRPRASALPRGPDWAPAHHQACYPEHAGPDPLLLAPRLFERIARNPRASSASKAPAIGVGMA
jgi:hypothetical protein